MLWSTPADTGLKPLVRDYRAAPNPTRKAAVEAYAAAHPEEAASAQLALGITAYEQKDYAAAIAALAPLPAKLPMISDYPAYYLAAARVESGDFVGVPKDLGPVHTGAVSPMSGKAWVLEARALETTAAPQAVQTLRDHYKELPQPDGDLTLAECYQAANDSANAVEFYQRVYTEYPLGPAADKASAALSALASSMGATFPQPIPEQLLRRADRLFALRAYAQARAEYQSAIDKLTGYQRDEARVRVGASDLAANNAATAYSYLSGLAVPESEADAERLYYVEECARKLNNDDGALAALKNLSEKHGKSGWRARALYSFANRYLLLNRTADFLPLYKELYSDFPKDGNAPTSRWKVTFQAYERNSADAEGLLRAHLETYPAHGTAGAAMYFLGRYYERKGQEAAARACYLKISERLPNGYYAILARSRLSTPGLSGPSSGSALAANTSTFLNSLRFPAIAPVPSQATAATTVRIDRSRALRAAGLTDLADTELRFGARTDAQPTLMAMETAASADAPYIGLKAMKAFASDYLNRPLASAPRQYWEYLYPLPFRDDLVADARAHNLDPYLVAGLIRQESEFNPAAISPAKANGLMQLELGTARDMGRSLGMPRVTLPMLLDAAPNLKIGTAVFRSMLDQNNGNVERTIAGYNAGPRRAAEWSTWNSFREPAEFIETIPFSETREYVQAVLRNADMYRRLYAQ